MHVLQKMLKNILKILILGRLLKFILCWMWNYGFTELSTQMLQPTECKINLKKIDLLKINNNKCRYLY